MLCADPGLLSKQFTKGSEPMDFFGGSTTSNANVTMAIKIILKDGRVVTIPFTDIERIEFVK